ncbi:MAG: PACE efflux transporter [Paucimonas sp.]|nr:PACE efflux transporter [Paucimonas sp.]
MQGPKRKIFQAVAYELVAVFCIAPAFTLFYDSGLAHSTALSLIISTVAVSWNMLYNHAFERIERTLKNRERTFGRRVIHAVGFEGGLTIMLVPLVSYWLGISLIQGLMTNLALFVFFFFYAFAFQWGFDRLFDVPESAKPEKCVGAG